MNQVVAVMPVFNPTPSFLEDFHPLYAQNFAHFIIINDGSAAKYSAVFETLQRLPNVVVLTHEKRLGKGAAVKTACSYLTRFLKNCQGVLFIGAYGQHKQEDVTRMLHVSRIYNDGIILGVRNFRARELPAFSRLGNSFVTMIFELRCRKRITDVQTGLRYIPMAHIPWIARIPSHDFDVDVYMLMEAVKQQIPIYEVTIGKALMKKNTFIQYDEAFRFRHMAKRIWRYRYMQE